MLFFVRVFYHSHGKESNTVGSQALFQWTPTLGSPLKPLQTHLTSTSNGKTARKPSPVPASQILFLMLFFTLSRPDRSQATEYTQLPEKQEVWKRLPFFSPRHICDKHQGPLAEWDSDLKSVPQDGRLTSPPRGPRLTGSSNWCPGPSSSSGRPGLGCPVGVGESS